MNRIIPEERIAETLTKTRKTLAVAESCTGGAVSSRITGIPGSSTYFRGGVVAYSNDIKTFLLGVSPETLKKHGAVSRQSALTMAKGVKSLMGSDLSAAITGIAGPSGGSVKKPVGLAYIAVFFGDKHYSKKVLLKGDRQDLKVKFADAVLDMICKIIPSNTRAHGLNAKRNPGSK
jgi:PncC family amidohydrolase